MLRKIRKRNRSGPAARNHSTARPRFRPALEALEARLAPTTTPLFSDDFNRANSTNLGANWTERTLASQIGVFSNTAAPGASASAASVATVIAAPQTNVRLVADVNLGATGGSTRGFGEIARYQGSGDTKMYLGWIVRRSGINFAEIWRNNGTDGNGGWGAGPLTQQVVTGLSGNLVFDVESVSATKTSLALYYNGAPVASTFDSTPVLQAAGQYGIRSWSFRPTLDNFAAYQLTNFGYDDVTIPPTYTDNFSSTSASTYINDHWTGRVGKMTVNNVTGLVTMASSGYSLTTLNSNALTNGGFTGRAADVTAHVDVGGVAATATGTAGFATNYAGPYLSNTYFGWVASRSGALTLEIYSLAPGDELDLLAASPLSSNTYTAGSLEFKEVGNYLTLTYTPDANPGDVQAITALDFHQNALGAGQVGIIGFGSGATVGGNTPSTQLTVSVPVPTTVGLPYNSLNGTHDNFYDSTPAEWTSQMGNLVHAGGSAISAPLGDPEEGELGASIATVNGPNLHDVEQTAFVDLSAATGSGGVLGGVISSYTGPSDRNMYLGAFVIRGGVASVEIDKNINGVWQYLATSGPLTAGANMANIDFKVVGTALSLSYSDNMADSGTVTFTDSTSPITGNGLIGIRTFGSNVLVNTYTAA